ncbi:unnamed protein product [Symbiodinium sp. CCMP2592]|nr:unnamed protein product [Symbiodinium sp. CCMP2592]
MDLHLRVPPERWGLTRCEFHTFVQEVRQLWSRGELPPPGEDVHGRRGDSRYGPNLYQVNEHYVKPITSAAGGMSYALMKHPDGLRCQVFISHAWAEGIFELDDLVRRGWPRLQFLHSLYCCLLANPQNLDLSALLNVPPMESPFAKAMQAASHVLVIPNHSVGIYTRLWCVYEAYLGACWKKTCIMPARPHTSTQCGTIRQTLMAPMAAGVLSGMFWWFILSHTDARDDNFLLVAIVMLLCATGTAVCFVVSILLKFCRWSWQTHFKFVRIGHMLLLFLCTLSFLPWLSFNRDERILPSAFDYFQHYFFPIVLILFNLLRIVQLNQHELELKELSRQASHLECDTVADATCSDPADEQRIRAAILGCEEEIDVTIRVLMRAGAYNDWLRWAYEAGVDIRGFGTSDLIVKTGLAFTLWALAALHSLGFRSCTVRCADTDRAWIDVSVGICALVALALPVTAFVLERYGPERAVFSVRVWTVSALLALGVPVFVGIEDHLSLVTGLRPASGMTEQCPAPLLRIMVTWFRPVLALLGTGLAVLGPGQVFRLQLAVAGFCDYSLPTNDSSETDASDSSSLLSLAQGIRRSRAMEAQMRIPPERWCITLAEFYAFVHEVRQAWTSGKVPEDDPGSNPRHGDPRHGPNLYQVNEHYVKPLTQAAGGMSYALMKHPEGLLCQVFISHAWAEGIFELSDFVRRGWPTILVPSIIGLMLGGMWILLLYHHCCRTCSRCFVDPVLSACVGLTLLCFVGSLVMEFAPRDLRMWIKCVVIRIVHILVICVCAAVAVPYSVLLRWKNSVWNHAFERLIPIALCLFNVWRTAQLSQHHLEDVELRRQASLLAIQTLEDATCSDPHDEAQIRQAIQGFEAEVDVTIRVLMQSGAYNDALREAYEQGEDISGEGNSDLIVKTGLVSLIWLLSTLDSAGFLDSYLVCLGPRYEQGTSGLLLLSVAVAIQAGALFLFPITAWHLQQTGLERGAFAVKVWTFSTLIGLGLPLLLEIQIRLMVVDACGGGAFEPFPNRCDAWDRWLIVAFLRPFTAVISFTCAVVGPPCYRRSSKRGDIQKASESSESESSASSEDTG